MSEDYDRPGRCEECGTPKRELRSRGLGRLRTGRIVSYYCPKCDDVIGGRRAKRRG